MKNHGIRGKEHRKIPCIQSIPWLNKVTIMINHSPILRRVQEYAKSQPEKTALVWQDQSVSYAQLWSRILAAAAALQSRGLSSGDCIGIVARKGLDFVYVYFGAQLIGVVNVVLDPEANEKRLDYIRSLTNPKLVVDSLELVEDAEPAPVDGLSQNDTADIVFTTGTTGAAKGVLLSHFNIYSSADNINGFIGNGPDEVEILGLPLCHSFGLGRLRCTLLNGATLVVLPSFANIKAFFAAMEKYHATGFGMVPAVWAYIRKFSGTRIAKYASQIKYIEIGSAAMPIESKKELCELFPKTRICHHYGLTEASRAAFMEYHACIDDLRTIGREVSDKVEIKIFDENGHEVPRGEPGEICVKGNMVMKGYFKPAEAAVAYFGDYFRTGDEGCRAGNGNLYLVSRKKEIINVGGKKVSPVEVEEAIIALGVEDCAVVGIPDPDGVLGEVPKVYVLRGGTVLSFDDIKNGLQGNLEPYKIPVVFDWIDAIPKTASGKKQRLQLAQRGNQ